MNGAGLLAVLVAAFVPAVVWAFRALPREEWQILACVPRGKNASGSWRGLNLTFYGFFTANAYLLAAAVFLMLMGAAGVPAPASLALIALLLGICVPASRLIARHVDRTKSGFTVGGASFAGLLAAPGAILAVDALSSGPEGSHIPMMPALAAAAIAYVCGEGAGRLACISFGCCYGKPLTEAGPWASRLFRRFHFVFQGDNKKIAYASGLQGVRVVPVQALSVVLLSALGIASAALFFHARYTAAFLLTVVVSQAWRAYSETLRADYRGEGKISVYQTMALMALPLAAGMAAWIPGSSHVTADVAAGLAVLWHPGVLLSLQAIWFASFLYTGSSETTASVLSLHVTPGFRTRRATPSGRV